MPDGKRQIPAVGRRAALILHQFLFRSEWNGFRKNRNALNGQADTRFFEFCGVKAIGGHEAGQQTRQLFPLPGPQFLQAARNARSHRIVHGSTAGEG